MRTLILRAAPPAPQRHPSHGPPVWYRVIGLPAGHEAKIRATKNGWQILHTVDGVPGYWSGSYPNRAAAVAVLQAAVRA